LSPGGLRGRPPQPGRKIRVHPSQPLRGETLRPSHDLRIEVAPSALQGHPIAMLRGQIRHRHRRRRVAKTAHPGLVGPQKMAHRPVNRAEEGATLAMALLVGEAIGGAVEVLVLPTIVERHALYVVDTDHQKSGLAPKRDIAWSSGAGRPWGLAESGGAAGEN